MTIEVTIIFGYNKIHVRESVNREIDKPRNWIDVLKGEKKFAKMSWFTIVVWYVILLIVSFPWFWHCHWVSICMADDVYILGKAYPVDPADLAPIRVHEISSVFFLTMNCIFLIDWWDLNIGQLLLSRI